VIPVETPEIDTGQPGEAVQGGAVAVNQGVIIITIHGPPGSVG